MPSHPSLLAPIVNGWRNKLQLAKDFKRKAFQDDADECMKFIDGAYGDWLYSRRTGQQKATALDFEPDENEPNVNAPTFRVTINKAAELRDLFGPAMYQRNPDRRVTPRKSYLPPIEYFGNAADPNAQMAFMQMEAQVQADRAKDQVVAELFEKYLNYTPGEHNLRGEARFAVDEAIVKGLAVAWAEVLVHPSGHKSVGSFYDPVENLLLDMDATRIEECAWVAKECVHPVWEVEDEYGYQRGTLKGNLESSGRMADYKGDATDEYHRSQGRTSDLMRYWKVWSKMGMGQRLEGVMKEKPDYGAALEELGDFCFLAISPDYEYPLNLPPWVMDQSDANPDAVRSAVQWPIPFWLDKGAWPFEPLAFHRVGGRLYPVSHLSPALGELKFINWVYSLLLGKIRVVSRDIMVLLRGLADDIKTAIKHGPDYTVIEIESLEKGVDNIVKFIQHPPFHPEIYKILDMMMELFDKRTGLTELIYGQSDSSFRSAEEAGVKNQAATVRPSDMAQQVEDWSSLLARKEMAAARWLIEPADVAPVVGQVGAWLWQQEVQAIPPAELFHSFECGVESGSTRKPNREKDADNLGKAMNNIFQPLMNFAQMTGAMGPVNALIGDWAKANGFDASKYLLAPPPPPPPVPVPGPPSAPGAPGATPPGMGGGGVPPAAAPPPM